MLAGSTFVDTNVLLYTFDSKNPQKQQRAREWIGSLWDKQSGRLSWQVLNEFYVNALRKLNVNESEAREVVSLYSVWRPLALDFVTVERAWHWRDKTQTPYWDSLILASAEQLGCAWLLSEDFQNGRKFAAVTVIDPFTQAP